MIKHDAVKKFNSYMTQHTDRLPLLSVETIEDKRFIDLRRTLEGVYGDIENNAWSVSQHLARLVDDLSSMELDDKKRLTGILSKYQVKGEVRPVSGTKTYGYDFSRVDGSMYKRRRSN
jgi:hypothetical protein|tara:strand:- start:55 stop:408 length:354 start_codon:yes stop_codon:yes gene_type:complete